jgi:hypothetical protein
MSASTTFRRALAASRSVNGSNRLGDWTSPASRADWATESFDAGTPKYRSAAAWTP